jgi:hypothetical protein
LHPLLQAAWVKSGIMQNRAFEKLSDIQKEKVISELHTHWSNPKSEIVKRMNS